MMLVHVCLLKRTEQKKKKKKIMETGPNWLAICLLSFDGSVGMGLEWQRAITLPLPLCNCNCIFRSMIYGHFGVSNFKMLPIVTSIHHGSLVINKSFFPRRLKSIESDCKIINKIQEPYC